MIWVSGDWSFKARKIKRINSNENFMQLGKFIDVFLARNVSEIYKLPSSGTLEISFHHVIF